MFDLSIEITTYNRKEILRDLLNRLSHQTYPLDRFEVVMSDDGSNDGLIEMLETLMPELPYATRVLQHKHQGPGHGHNAGIRASQSELVLMLAADILPSETLVEGHIEAHRRNPEPHIVVAGKLTQSEQLPDTVIQRAANVEVEKIFVSESDQVEHGGFLVSNLSFKKSFMLEHGMFHEWPPASGEDIELGYRMKKAGMKVLEEDAALGFHHHEETFASIAKRAYMTGYNSHHFSAEVNERWVRQRFGFPEPDAPLGSRLKLALRDTLRAIFVNRLTANLIMIPAIRAADQITLLLPLTPILCKKMSAYFFKRGLADFRASRPFQPPEIPA